MEQRNALRFQGNRKIIRNTINGLVAILGSRVLAIAVQAAGKGTVLPCVMAAGSLADARFSPKSMGRQPSA